ncbi:hypothetical protein L3081_16215 [Colwellia sp. MSW7]|uniref:Lipoprotein n=1 Tax=Colwellia maritima TaxID=2912588 RepID=A0ABS9X5E1_9GAMM|nr:hypothetical protein [Colwellia maritima]MCI2284651.1 hypothetical protein [Colwellia maritima]
MKQLFALVLIISITVISWSSCAKNTKIKTNHLYNQSVITITPVFLTSSLTNDVSNESFTIMPNKTLNKHNFLFESTMIFNDKLHQFIAFFNRFYNGVDDVASNNLQKTQKNTQKCSENS